MKIKRSLSENTSCVLRSESTMSVRSLPGESPRRKFMKNTPILNMPFTYQQIVQKVDQQTLCHFLRMTKHIRYFLHPVSAIRYIPLKESLTEQNLA